MNTKPYILTGRDKIVLNFNRGSQDPKYHFNDHIATHKFPSPAAAKGFVEAVIKECFERVPEPSKVYTSSNRLVLNDWIVIRAEGPHTLEDILATKKSEPPPKPYDAYAEQISAYHWGVHPQVNERTRSAQHRPPLSEQEKQKHAPHSEIRASNEANALRRAREARESRQAARPPKTGKPAAEKAPRASREGVKRSPEGYLSLEALGFDARMARTALRAAATPKPAQGWCWPASEKEKATKLVKDAIKKAGK